ncbi:hypothetical protein [Phenylobacterium sp.]|uniref:hypothetical protein n=1 Tax=Phenylobacterium sp. TaxID=1871053 RepID=UPI002DED78E6|nr:hypothetical protein [Phenylobacterium sp.]
MNALWTGAGVALAAGLLMGAVAKPDLGGDDRPAGPQILAGWGGGRSTGPFDDGAAFANFKGQLPDYVLGTDWKRSLNPPALTAEPSPLPRETKMAAIETPPDLPLTRATYQEPPREPPSYPSIEGGQTSDAGLPPPARPETGDDGRG